jgi:hypothetical protein
LEGLKAAKEPRQLASNAIVRQPLVLYRRDFAKARDRLRPLQHTYCREALIDIVALPPVLAAPRRWRTGFADSHETGVDNTILVPDGPVESWGPTSRAVRPLTDESVQSLERPYCKVTVITPPGASSSAGAAYIWDRVRSTLLEANIELLEEVGPGHGRNAKKKDRGDSLQGEPPDNRSAYNVP